MMQFVLDDGTGWLSAGLWRDQAVSSNIILCYRFILFSNFYPFLCGILHYVAVDAWPGNSNCFFTQPLANQYMYNLEATFIA